MRRLARLLPLCAVLAAAPVAHAQSPFSLAPVVLSLDPARTLVGSVTFTNTSRQPVRVDASVSAWSMRDGQHTEAPTRDLLLNPSTFTVGPGESQLIRVALRRKPGAQELTYRLRLDQRSLEAPPIPAASAASPAGPPARGNAQDPASAPEIQTRIVQLFSVALPVYFTPSGTAPKLGFVLGRQGADLSLTIQNTGTRHETLYDLTLTRAGKILEFPPNAVLVGGFLIYPLGGWGDLGGEVSLSYRTPAGETVRVAPTLP